MRGTVPLLPIRHHDVVLYQKENLTNNHIWPEEYTNMTLQLYGGKCHKYANSYTLLVSHPCRATVFS